MFVTGKNRCAQICIDDHFSAFVTYADVMHPSATPPARSPDSRTFLGDVEIRANVAYMVAPGTKLSFGSCGENEFEVVFEELSADSPMMDMLMKGMARSDEVKKQLGQ